MGRSQRDPSGAYYGHPLNLVTSVQIPRWSDPEEPRTMTGPAVVGNLRKARKSRERLSIIFGWDESNPRVSGDVLQGSCEGGTYFWIRDVGDDPPAWAGRWGGVQPKGGQTVCREGSPGGFWT